MSAITLVNRTAAPAVFYLSQAGTQTGRVAVAPRARVTIPSSDSYVVSATTTMANGYTYATAPTEFSATAQEVLAQVQQTGGTLVFDVARLPGSQLATIRLTNTTASPVQFTIARNGSPLASVQVLDAFESGAVSTKREYEFFAVVDGITTATISTTDSDPNVVVVSDTRAAGSLIGYSVEFV